MPLPYVKYFDMPIWHPTDEATLDALLDAQVDIKAMSASLIVSHGCDFCVASYRYSSKAGSVKKMYLVNKNIVNLIDDVFWKMGFKTETDAEKVIIRIISLKLDYTDYTNYIYCFCCRFAWILELPITCGRTNALISPDRLKPWPITFVQPCVLVG